MVNLCVGYKFPSNIVKQRKLKTTFGFGMV